MSNEITFYASVLGGWVCSACGSLVHDQDLHVTWHGVAA